MIFMAELPRKISAEEWRAYWKDRYYNATIYNWIKANGREYPPMKWIDSKTIRLIKMPEVEEGVVPHVKAGIEELIKEVGLDFRAEEFDPSIEFIEGLRRCSTIDGRLDKDKLLQFLVSYQDDGSLRSNGGRRHADYIITDKVIFAQEYKDCDDIVGIGLYAGGVGALSIPQHDEKMRGRAIISSMDRAKHEAAHLLGLTLHHREPLGFDGTEVAGYAEVPSCNMEKNVPSSSTTCDGCIDAIRSVWEGAEYCTRRQFLKRRNMVMV